MELKTEAMTVVLTNEADDSREYTIRADVHVRDGKFVSADNGQVFNKVNNNGMYVVYFNVGNDGSLTVNYQDSSLTDTQQVTILNLIHQFITSAKAAVNTATE